jgi:hypothetical protein
MFIKMEAVDGEPPLAYDQGFVFPLINFKIVSKCPGIFTIRIFYNKRKISPVKSMHENAYVQYLS